MALGAALCLSACHLLFGFQAEPGADRADARPPSDAAQTADSATITYDGATEDATHDGGALGCTPKGTNWAELATWENCGGGASCAVWPNAGRCLDDKHQYLIVHKDGKGVYTTYAQCQLDLSATPSITCANGRDSPDRVLFSGGQLQPSLPTLPAGDWRLLHRAASALGTAKTAENICPGGICCTDVACPLFDGFSLAAPTRSLLRRVVDRQVSWYECTGADAGGAAARLVCRNMATQVEIYSSGLDRTSPGGDLLGRWTLYQETLAPHDGPAGCPGGSCDAFPNFKPDAERQVYAVEHWDNASRVWYGRCEIGADGTLHCTAAVANSWTVTIVPDLKNDSHDKGTGALPLTANWAIYATAIDPLSP